MGRSDVAGTMPLLITYSDVAGTMSLLITTVGLPVFYFYTLWSAARDGRLCSAEFVCAPAWPTPL